MSRTLRNILEGVVATVRRDRVPDRLHVAFRHRLDEVLAERPRDAEMVMLDMRRVLLRNLDTMPDDERARVSRELDAARTLRFERRIGLADYTSGRGNGRRGAERRAS